MKIFCTFCGAAQELEAPRPRVLCAQCGKEFVVQAQPGAAPGPAPSPKVAAKGASTAVIVIILIGVGGLCLVAFVGMLAAIAIPNFIRFQARSKQAEAKANLRMLYTAEKSFYAENDRYTTNPEDLGVRIEPGNRYAYFADAAAPIANVDVQRHPETAPISAANLPNVPGIRPGIKGNCPKCEITLVAAGNIDSDPTLDVWSISTADRTGPHGEPLPQGVPSNDVNDVVE